jgi:hypothetical protein
MQPNLLTHGRKDCWESHLAVYREDSSKDKVTISAAVFENELALVVYMDDRGNLELRGLRIINGPEATSPPTVENLGANSPLSYYPNFISIIKQSDGTVYGFLSSSEHVKPSGSKFSPKEGTVAIRDMFRYEGVLGFVRVNSLEDYWPVEPYRKLKISDQGLARQSFGFLWLKTAFLSV